jgi:hypothetical protein
MKRIEDGLRLFFSRWGKIAFYYNTKSDAKNAVV